MDLINEFKKIDGTYKPKKRKSKAVVLKKHKPNNVKKKKRNPSLKSFSLRQLKAEIQARGDGNFEPKALPDVADFTLNIGESGLESIMITVSSKTKIRIGDIVSKNRIREVVRARHLYFYLSNRVFGFSLSSVGNYIYRDHSTVIHACRKISKKMIEDPELVAFVDDLIKYCKLNKVR